MDEYDLDRPQWDNAEGIARRTHDTRTYSSDAGMGPEDFAFDNDEEQYDGRQRYYRSRPSLPQPPRGRPSQPRGRYENQRQEHATMANPESDDWTQQVRQNWQRGPYRDYGWERRESVLPEFRDPSVHLTPEEEEEARSWRQRQRRGGQRPDFREAYDTEYGGGLTTGERQIRYGGGGYGTETWNVPGPHRGRGPRTYQRSNERIREDVNERLTQHGYLDATDVEVRVEDGEVWLTGMVDSRRAKRLAEDVADSVTGVKDVHNELRIRDRESGSMDRTSGA